MGGKELKQTMHKPVKEFRCKMEQGNGAGTVRGCQIKRVPF